LLSQENELPPSFGNELSGLVGGKREDGGEKFQQWPKV
jgi:hypothetical protein